MRTQTRGRERGVPAWIVTRADLTEPERRLAALIAVRSNRDGECCLNNLALARALAMPAPAVRVLLSRLIDRGLVTLDVARSPSGGWERRLTLAGEEAER